MSEAISAAAVVATAPGAVDVDTVRLAHAGETDVLVRTLFSGVSTGTDKWVLQGRFRWNPVRFPCAPGYQRVGVVEALGAGADDFHVGQVVVVSSNVDFRGAMANWGGHCAVGLARRSDVYPADGIPPMRAALFIVGQVGVNAASRVAAPPGARVLVVGDGIIGASAALAARARGFEVLCLGHHADRLASIALLGLATAVAGGDAGPRAAAFEPQAVIDTVQNQQAFDAYIGPLAESGGELVYSGHTPDGATSWADMARLQQAELTVHFVSGWTEARVLSTLELMRSGALPLERLLGDVAQTRDEVAALARRVASGKSRPVAAAMEWSWAG
jgi:2-desacetyl-2-hydroxyethyl bacteriochlorophyllide A dehydrogenase